VPMITKVQKMVDVPQVEIVDVHVHIPVQKHRQVPTITKVQKPVEITVIETVEKIVDVPIVKQIEVPQVQTIEKIVEIPYIQIVEKIVEVPMVGETVQGTQRVTQVQLETEYREEAAVVETQVVQGPPLPAEQGGTTIIEGQAPPQYGYAQGAVRMMGASTIMEPVATHQG